MNGEIQQASNIVISARKALFENEKIDFTPSKHTLSIQFIFARKLLFHKSVQANSVCEWFDVCLQRGLKDIKFVIPTNRENKHLLGFANTSQCVIVCFWKNGNTSCFCPFWEFDREQNKWKIIYNEQYIKKHTVFDNLHFTDKTNEFKQTLLDIGEFAAKIEQQYFSDVFHNAYEALCGLENINDENVGVCFDSGHYHAFNKDEFDFETVKGKIFEVHLHDNNSEKDWHYLPFDGNIPWKDVLDKVKASGYDGFITLEPAYWYCYPGVMSLNQFYKEAYERGCKLTELAV